MILEIIFLGLLLLFIITNWPMLRRRSTLPPGPFPWPILGNLLQLDPVQPQKTCQKWSKVYGPVFTVWLGSQPMVMVTDYELMKDALTKHGDQLSQRPRIYAYDYFTRGK